VEPPARCGVYERVGVCELTLNPNNAQVDFLPAPLPDPGSPGSDRATVAVRP
jgi:hypothetical protein